MVNNDQSSTTNGKITASANDSSNTTKGGQAVSITESATKPDITTYVLQKEFSLMKSVRKASSRS
ncbi:hypothetical protein AAHB53_23725 [Niallia circulans]